MGAAALAPTGTRAARLVRVAALRALLAAAIVAGLLSMHGPSALAPPAAAAPDGSMIDLDGEARWARLVTADGLWALDCAVAVDAEGSTAGLLIAGTQAGPNGGALLYKGGRLPPVELALR